MGLAGRKQKQRIPADPRNLSWAGDASRFGHAYLSKFGWNTSQGLGSSGDGMKTHLKVQQKLDMMGIGAQHQRDPNGIAWKQNNEFEALLKRLNESVEQGNAADDEDNDEKVRDVAMGGAFVRAQEPENEVKLEKAKKKRKHKGGDDAEASEEARKKQKKEKCRKPKASSDDAAAPAIDLTSEAGTTTQSIPSTSYDESIPTPKSKPRPMAHRARIRAAKSIADKSALAISEILGIAPSSFVSTSTSETPTPPSSSIPTPQPLSLGTLTTSTKSVADYFKEKLASRELPSSTSSGSVTPAAGLGLSRPQFTPPNDNSDELPRRGIGSRAPDPTSTVVIDARSEDVDADTLTEKQRHKAVRKAAKRKRQGTETEAEMMTPKDPDASAEVKNWKVNPRSLEGKREKERELERQGFTGQLNGPLPDAKANKKSKDKHKKKQP